MKTLLIVLPLTNFSAVLLGVGLIKQEQAAAAIVNEVRSGILQALQDVRARLS